MSMHSEDVNRPALVVKCAFVWATGNIELQACSPGRNKVFACTIGDGFSPADLRDAAVKFGAYIEVIKPGVWNVGFHSYLNQQYNQAKLSFKSYKKPLPVFNLVQGPKPAIVHTCTLQGGIERDSDGIPGDGVFEAWKTWSWDESLKRLVSPSHNSFVWEPLQVIEAKCAKCPAPPCTRCTCGIYAGDESQASDYGEILGMLKQWGRFVKGGTGVKSQFAYPAWFLLKPGQEPMIDQLQIYGVPIKMTVTTNLTVWDPKEEGFATPGQEGDNTDEYR